MSLSLPLIPGALAIYRIRFVNNYEFSQPQRTLYATLECFASCTVANAIVLNSFVRDKGPKRNKYRGPGGKNTVYSPDQINARGRGGLEATYALDMQSMRTGMKVWGSDEDLVKGMGVGMGQELRKMSNVQPNARSSAVTTSSSASSTHEGAPAWTANWEDPQVWTERRGSESGVELIIPPPPSVMVHGPPPGRSQPTQGSEEFGKMEGAKSKKGGAMIRTSMDDTFGRDRKEKSGILPDPRRYDSNRVSLFDVGGLLTKQDVKA